LNSDRKLYGDAWSDTVCINVASTCTTPTNFIFQGVNSEKGLYAIDGVLGLGPDYLKNGTSFMTALMQSGAIN
jgi:hypothetical protein